MSFERSETWYYSFLRGHEFRWGALPLPTNYVLEETGCRHHDCYLCTTTPTITQDSHRVLLTPLLKLSCMWGVVHFFMLYNLKSGSSHLHTATMADPSPPPSPRPQSNPLTSINRNGLKVVLCVWLHMYFYFLLTPWVYAGISTKILVLVQKRLIFNTVEALTKKTNVALGVST